MTKKQRETPLQRMAQLADKTCAVVCPDRVPHYCPHYPDCGCDWPGTNRTPIYKAESSVKPRKA